MRCTSCRGLLCCECIYVHAKEKGCCGGDDPCADGDCANTATCTCLECDAELCCDHGLEHGVSHDCANLKQTKGKKSKKTSKKQGKASDAKSSPSVVKTKSSGVKKTKSQKSQTPSTGSTKKLSKRKMAAEKRSVLLAEEQQTNNDIKADVALLAKENNEAQVSATDAARLKRLVANKGILHSSGGTFVNVCLLQEGQVTVKTYVFVRHIWWHTIVIFL